MKQPFYLFLGVFVISTGISYLRMGQKPDWTARYPGVLKTTCYVLIVLGGILCVGAFVG